MRSFWKPSFGLLKPRTDVSSSITVRIGLRSNYRSISEMIQCGLANGSIPFGNPHPSERRPPKIPRRRMTTILFPMKTNLFLIGTTIFLAACTDAQVPPNNRSATYPFNPAIVRKVQIALRNRGYYHGLVDGFLGGATGTAIQRFQMDHSLRVIPLLDPSLLVSLGVASEY